MFVNRAPLPPRFGKFSSTARWKALQSLYCTIRRLFVLFADYSYYSSTIRGLFVLFVDYSRTIRTIRRLFADYSYYSSTIRTIRTFRFTILVLSIAVGRRRFGIFRENRLLMEHITRSNYRYFIPSIYIIFNFSPRAPAILAVIFVGTPCNIFVLSIYSPYLNNSKLCCLICCECLKLFT